MKISPSIIPFMHLMVLALATTLSGLFSCGTHRPGIYSQKLLTNSNKPLVYKLHPDYKIYYAVSNTPSDLKLNLKVRDEQSIGKILFFGLTVWIDSTGKRKKVKGIEYPLAASQRSRPGINQGEEEQHNNRRSMTQKQRMGALRSQFKEGLQEADLHNFSADGPDRIILPDRRGLSINIDFDSTGVMLYELKVPFSFLGISSEKLFADSTKSLAFGFISGKPNRAKSSDDGSSGQGMGGGMGGGIGGSGGMGGMGGGGMGGRGGMVGGGRGGQGGGSGMPSFEPVTFWINAGFKP